MTGSKPLKDSARGWLLKTTPELPPHFTLYARCDHFIYLYHYDEPIAVFGENYSIDEVLRLCDTYIQKLGDEIE